MNDELPDRIRRLAEAAREVEEAIKPLDKLIDGETWVVADWLADELADLDMELALEAISP